MHSKISIETEWHRASAQQIVYAMVHQVAGKRSYQAALQSKNRLSSYPIDRNDMKALGLFPRRGLVFFCFGGNPKDHLPPPLLVDIQHLGRFATDDLNAKQV